MATIGRRAAVAELPLHIRLGGTLGWLSWLGLHIVFLIGFRNRIVVFVNWVWNYLTWDRGNRVVIPPE
jgi:NADH dehydrogenase